MRSIFHKFLVCRQKASLGQRALFHRQPSCCFYAFPFSIRVQTVSCRIFLSLRVCELKGHHHVIQQPYKLKACRDKMKYHFVGHSGGQLLKDEMQRPHATRI